MQYITHKHPNAEGIRNQLFQEMCPTHTTPTLTHTNMQPFCVAMAGDHDTIP